MFQRFYQLLCKLVLMLGMPALVIVIRESPPRDHSKPGIDIFRPPLRHHRARFVSAVYLLHDHSNQSFSLVDRRYMFIEQAGCIPSISPSLFPSVAVLVWPLLFNVASLAYLGAAFFFDICMQ